MMMMNKAAMLIGCVSFAILGSAARAEVDGWLRWRGPLQSGVSLEVDLPEAIDVENAKWTVPLSGRGTPVIADGRVYTLAYTGTGPDLDQMLLCLDETSGNIIWEHRYKDFLSDTVYDRYCISSPSIDAETGNVYFLSTEGILNCFSRDGDLVWQHSMIESYGMLTYPNARTVSPLIDGELAIVHCMTSAWGPDGPARNRFFAFDKRTGEHLWTSSPDGAPKDNPYSFPVFEWRDGKRLLYAGTAGGAIVCVNARTGEAAWRYTMSVGGVCASPLLHGDQVLVHHARENLDSSTAGRTLAIKLGAYPGEGQPRPLELGADHVAWSIDQLGAFSSSPVLVGDRMYLTTDTGELVCVDVTQGKALWHHKLAPDQIHASPLYADGKLYVPMNNGSFFVVRPTESGPEVLSQTQLAGNCLGAPAIWNGRIYVHTNEMLYCFGDGSGTWSGEPAAEIAPIPGPAVSMQVVPADITIQPGESLTFRTRLIDAAGLVVGEVEAPLAWQANPLGLTFDAAGLIADTSSARPGAAALTAEANGMKATVRVRVTYPMPFADTFDGVNLALADPADASVKIARPPSHWLGSGPKWEVREAGSGGIGAANGAEPSKIIAKTIADPIFQRAFGFFGHPDWHDYTVEADVMSEGNRRNMSSIGLVNQRYLIQLKGNHQEIEIQSNHERVKHSAPFAWRANTWYRLKTQCVNNDDGSVTIRGKAWPRGETEPADWTIEYTHANGLRHGAAGLFGFSFNDRFRVFLDNLAAYPNE
jgi:outer membrane protein assembly factor BamB